MPNKRFFLKGALAERYGVTPRSIDCVEGKFPPPDLIMPTGRRAWADSTIEQHERMCARAAQPAIIDDAGKATA